MEINNITVKEAIIMSTATMEKIGKAFDLTRFSASELKEALAKVEAKKDDDRNAYKELVEQTVPKAIFKLCLASETLSNAKTEAFQYFEDILKLKAEVYGIKEKQQSHTFSFDGGEVQIGYRITDGWDDTVNAGIAKVEKYISSLAKTPETADLVDVVFNLLKKDAKGNLKSSRVLELQKWAAKRNNEEFKDGVDIISKAYKPVRSVWFVEATLIDENKNKTPIPLSMSAVDFSKGYKFEFYNEVITETNAPE
jgi:hypothetical protein